MRGICYILHMVVLHDCMIAGFKPIGQFAQGCIRDCRVQGLQGSLRMVAQGLRFMVYGLWFMVHGSMSRW